MVWMLSLWLVLQAGDADGAAAARIEGVVRDTAGKPVVGATVTLSQEATGRVRIAVTDVHGRFSLAALDLSGPIAVRVEHREYSTMRTEVDVDDPGTMPLHLTLNERRRSRGRP